MSGGVHAFVATHEEAGLRLDVWLARRRPELSRSRVQALIEEGRATLNGAPGKASASGMPWPRLHQSSAELEKPRLLASVVTKMTPVLGTSRNAEKLGASAAAGAGAPGPGTTRGLGGEVVDIEAGA